MTMQLGEVERRAGHALLRYPNLVLPARLRDASVLAPFTAYEW